MIKVESTMPNSLLLLAAALSATAALLHLVIIAIGAPGYRFFGAGKRMVRLAERRHWSPAVITLGIALVLLVWAGYSVSAAGAIAPLPFVKPILVLITAVYLLRGLVVLPLFVFARPMVTPFWWWSSAICLGFGLVHAAGLAQVWSHLQGG